MDGFFLIYFGEGTFQVPRHSKYFDEEPGEERCRKFLLIGGLFVQVDEIERGSVLLLFRFWDDIANLIIASIRTSIFTQSMTRLVT